MSINIVIGAGYGDCGKGKIVDYLSDELTLNIKFTGGGQAGHTVFTPDGLRHIFSTYGSGTFQMADTYLSHHFIFNPMVFEKEYNELLGKIFIKEYSPSILANESCNITTPYDMMINQSLERSRGEKKHGSVGLGINETLYRANNGFKLTIRDFVNGKERRLLRDIRDQYLPLRLEELEIEVEDIAFDSELMYAFIDNTYRMLNIVTSVENNSNYFKTDNLVFEGAQGLGLDKRYHHFPHVTNGNTGLKNVIELLKENMLLKTPKNIYYVTRPYKTRHGAGPLEHERIYGQYHDNTNVYNEWQENLRFGILDINVLTNDINRDIIVNREGINDHDQFFLVINCMDHMKDWFSYYHNYMFRGDNDRDKFINIIIKELNQKTGKKFNCLLGTGETRDNIDFYD
jgi:adenylosuccinate synthase